MNISINIANSNKKTNTKFCQTRGKRKQKIDILVDNETVANNIVVAKNIIVDVIVDIVEIGVGEQVGQKSNIEGEGLKNIFRDDRIS